MLLYISFLISFVFDVKGLWEKKKKKFYKILSNVRQLSFIQMLLYVEHLSQCLLNFLTYTLKEINSAFYNNYITNVNHLDTFLLWSKGEMARYSYIIILFYLIWWISLRLNSMNRSHFYFLLILRNTGYKSKGLDVIRSKILKLISG